MAPTEPAASERYAAATRAEAMTLMAEVEHFYKSAEPSSPVPMLLAQGERLFQSRFQCDPEGPDRPPPAEAAEKKRQPRGAALQSV